MSGIGILGTDVTVPVADNGQPTEVVLHQQYHYKHRCKAGIQTPTALQSHYIDKLGRL
jgi:hypothetical protein